MIGRTRLVRQLRERRGRTSAAFTLLETALAIVIVGSGVVAVVFAQQALHRQNEWAAYSSTATFLANEIRELALNMPRHDPVTGRTFWGPEDNEASILDFDDLDDFDGWEGNGTVYSWEDGTGPINALREVIPNMPGWKQTVTVNGVDSFDVSAEPDPLLDGTTNMVRVEVIISFISPATGLEEEMTRMSWVSSR